MAESPASPRVVASPSASTCLDEPWAWLPTSNVTRMAIDAEAVRRSPYAALIRRVLDRRGFAELVDLPIERCAVAVDDHGSKVAAVRSSEPMSDGTRLTDRIWYRAEGDFLEAPPRHSCASPGRGWFYFEASPRLAASFGMLEGLGFPRMKRLTMSLLEDEHVLVASGRLSFEGRIDASSTVVQSFLRGLQEAVQERVPRPARVFVEDNDVVVRFVAESELHVEQLLEALVAAMGPHDIPVEEPPYRTERVVPPSPIPATQGANFGTITLAPGFVPDPAEFSGTSGGPVDASTWAPSCVGFVSAQPDHVLVLSAPARELAWMVRSADDVTLVVELPTGELLCDDDYEDQDPLVVTESLPAGTYRIWVGSFAAGANHPYTLGISELPSTVPSSLTPP